MTADQEKVVTDLRNRLAYFEQPFEELFAPNLDGSAIFVSIADLQTILAMLPLQEIAA